MYLQRHLRLQASLANHPVNSYHRELYQISCRPLQRRIHGRAFGESAQVEVFAVDVGNRAHPAKQSLNPAFTPGVIESAINELAHPMVFLEVSFDKFLRL